MALARGALLDPRWLGLLALSIVICLALLLTPLAGRAWLVLGWGLVVYVAACVVSSVLRRPSPANPAEPAVPAPPVAQASAERAHAAAVEPANASSAAPARVAEAQAQSVSASAATEPAELQRATEQALRRLNDPAALTDCSLTAQLPRTIQHLCASNTEVVHPGRALRSALMYGIDRLKPPESARSDEQMLPHAILHDEYVLGHSTARIMAHYAISESTFHRYRRAAIRVLAQDLAQNEAHLQRLAVTGPATTPAT